jgi:hypothetical protein
MSEFFMRFVPHEKVASYEALGWIARDATPGSHGVYSRVMKWEGEGEPPEPGSFERALQAIVEGEGA